MSVPGKSEHNVCSVQDENKMFKISSLFTFTSALTNTLGNSYFNFTCKTINCIEFVM